MIIEWFQKVGAVYRMDDVTIDNAIFFLDSYLYSQMNSGSSMLREDFQVIITTQNFTINCSSIPRFYYGFESYGDPHTKLFQPILQMIAMVSLLISSKMFGIVGCQVSIVSKMDDLRPMSISVGLSLMLSEFVIKFIALPLFDI